MSWSAPSEECRVTFCCNQHRSIHSSTYQSPQNVKSWLMPPCGCQSCPICVLYPIVKWKTIRTRRGHPCVIVLVSSTVGQRPWVGNIRHLTLIWISSSELANGLSRIWIKESDSLLPGFFYHKETEFLIEGSGPGLSCDSSKTSSVDTYLYPPIFCGVGDKRGENSTTEEWKWIQKFPKPFCNQGGNEMDLPCRHYKLGSPIRDFSNRNSVVSVLIVRIGNMADS